MVSVLIATFVNVSREKHFKIMTLGSTSKTTLGKVKTLMNLCKCLLNTVIGSLMFPIIHVNSQIVHSLYRKRIEFTHLTSVPIIFNFKCDLCDKKYEFATSLEDHINIEHNPNFPPPSKWAKTIVLSATPCSKNNIDFQTHMWLEHSV